MKEEHRAWEGEPGKAEGSGAQGKLCSFSVGVTSVCSEVINKFGTCSPSSLWSLVVFFPFFPGKFLAVGRTAARV